MTEVEALKGVIDRLKDPTHWVKGIRALTEHGWDTAPTSPEAVQWCLGGAVINVLQNEHWAGWFSGDPIGKRFHELARARGFTGPHGFVDFNNDPATTHEDLMLFLKEALYDAEIQEHQTGPVRISDVVVTAESIGYASIRSGYYYSTDAGWKLR